MKRKHFLVFLSTALIACVLALGFHSVTPKPTQAQSNATLLISAAASLQNAMEEIKLLYQQDKSNVSVNFNFGASGALQQQIEQGASVDVFISAGTKQMNALEQKGLLRPGTRANLAKNRLVLIVPKNNAANITSLNNLTDSWAKRIAIGEPRSVPAGQYAQQALQQLNIFDTIKPKFVYFNNVRQVLAAVESGNADAGLVYATDAKISDKVKVVVTVDEKYHSQIVYPMAVVKSSKYADIAAGFVQYLSGDIAKAILRKYGFITP